MAEGKLFNHPFCVVNSLDQLTKSGWDESQLLIGTHGGGAHADDVLAATLVAATSEDPFAPVFVIRTRDPEIWGMCNVLLDVGEELDPTKQHFDHHQSDCTVTVADIDWEGRPPSSVSSDTLLSTAGLVWSEWGKTIIRHLVGPDSDERFVDAVFVQFYEELVACVDRVDNGQPTSVPGETQSPCRVLDFSSMIRMSNTWSTGRLTSNEVTFLKMAEWTSFLVENLILSLYKRETAMDYVFERCRVAENGILILERNEPFMDNILLFEQSSEGQNRPPIKVVVFPNGRLPGGKTKWSVLGYRPSKDAPNRALFPQEFRDAVADGTAEQNGVPGIVFVHKAGFTGAADNRKCAEWLANCMEDACE